MDQVSEKRERITPRCIGIIMDGNRRWARTHGYSLVEGHTQGYECLLRCRSFARENGIEYVILYAFSTENWRRSEEEVGYLIQLFRRILRDEWQRLAEEETRVIFIGERAKFPEDVQHMMADMERRSAAHKGVVLVVALSYGGRAEIVDTARRLAQSGGDFTEESFGNHLWTGGIPNPDLIIRTGGAHRLSNFLIWQAAYAELYFTDILWPDFNKTEFEKALSFFAEAKRNFGA